MSNSNKSITVKLKIQSEIYHAAQQFMEEKGLKIEDELTKSVEKFYTKHVPAAVRSYIERSTPVSFDVSDTSPAPMQQKYQITTDTPPKYDESDPDSGIS